mgnify:CR=1 FL=1
MNIPHLPAMLLFAFFVSVVFGVLDRDTRRDRLIYSLKVFFTFLAIALGLSWLMHPFPP